MGRYSYRGEDKYAGMSLQLRVEAERTRCHGHQRQHHLAPQPNRLSIRLLLHAGTTRSRQY